MREEFFANFEMRTGVENIKDDEDDCCICLSESRTMQFMPCNHKVICEECAETYKNYHKECPFCREPYDSIEKFSTKKKLGF